MASNIKGITIEIDGSTTKLNDALKTTEKSTQSVNGELKKVDGLLKFNPSSTELISQKQKLLATNVQNTSSKLDTLKNAQAQVDAQFNSGDLGADEYRAFQREVVATEGKLNSYKSQLNSAQSAQQTYSASVQRLEMLFKATDSSIDSFSSVLGSKLTSAIKSGTASSNQLDTAFSKIAQQSGIARSDVSNLANAMDKFDGTPAGLKQTVSEIDQLASKSKESGTALGNFKEKLSFGAVASIGANAVSTLTGGMGELISETTQTSDAMDKFNSTMSGAGFGKAEIKEAGSSMKKYADDTVYDTQTVMNTTAQLAANGIQNYGELTEASGNMNAQFGGTADTFQSVAMVMTQTAGAGKLTTENWNQLADAIPGASGVLQEAMKKNGAYTGNFRDAMEQGQISSDEFNQAVTQLGMNDGAVKAAKSTSTFEGAIGSMQANIVTKMNEVVETIGKDTITDAIQTMANGIVKALSAIVKVLVFVSQHATAFKVLATAILVFATAVKVAQVAQALFNVTLMANPIFLVITAIVALVAGLVVFFTQTKKGQEIWKSFISALVAMWQGLVKSLTSIWNSISTAATTIFNAVKDGISTAFNAVATVIGNVWDTITSTLTSVWDGIVNIATTVFNTIKNVIILVFMGIQAIIQGIWIVITSMLSVVWNGIVALVTIIWAPISAFFQTLWTGISNIFMSVWNSIVAFLAPIFTTIATMISTVWNGIVLVFQTVFNLISNVVMNAWNAISTATTVVFSAIGNIISTIWNGILTAISTVVNVVISVVSSAWNAISSVTVSVFGAIVGVVSSIWNGIKSTVSNVVNGVKSVITGTWNAISSVTRSAFNAVKSAIEGPLNSAKNTVSNVINAIKGFFSGLHLSFPKIKMPSLPHFKLNGKFSLNPPSVPHLNVDWYANGGIMTKPTMFAQKGGRPQIGGEAGPEGVIPLNAKTLGQIGQGIADAMGGSQSAGPTYMVLDGQVFAQLMNRYQNAVQGTAIGLEKRGLAGQ